MKKFDFLTPLKFLPLVGFLLLICLYYVIHKPFDGGGISRIVSSVWCLIMAFAIVALAGGLGRWMLNRLLSGEKNLTILSFVLGLGSLSLVFLLVGMIIGIHPWWAWTVLIALTVLLRRHIFRWVIDFFSESVDIWRHSESLGKVIGWICLIILFSTLVIAFAPPIKFDTLVYHLALPREYIELGNLNYRPGNMFWGMPQIGEMLYTWAMLLAGGRAAVCLGWLIGVITLGGLLQFAARRFNATVGWVAIAGLLSGYTLAASLSWGYIDWFTILFGLGVLILLDQWIETEGKKELILTGVLAGFCLGSKYTAGVIVLAVVAVILWKFFSSIFSKTVKNNNIRILITIVFSLFLFCLSVILITLPWWLKNFLGTGNPFYPFLFPSGAMDAFRLDFYQIPALDSIWETLLLPLTATFLGVEGAAGYSASIGPLLLGLGVFSWLPQPSQTEKQKQTTQMCLVIVLTGLLVWMVGSRFSGYLIQTRLYFAILPALAILSGLGFNGFSQLRPFGIRLQNVVGALIIMCLSYSAFEVSKNMIKTGSLEVLTNLESEEDYLSNNLGWYYPAVNEIANSQPNLNVMMLFEPRGYFCLPYCDPDEILDRWKHDLDTYEDPSKVLNAWKDQGFNHLLFNRFGADFVKESDSRYQSDDWEKLEELLSKLPMTADFGGAYYLYALTP